MYKQGLSAAVSDVVEYNVAALYMYIYPINPR